ncbi:2823_t:CDS:2, partial [Scutellospora calospora]
LMVKYRNNEGGKSTFYGRLYFDEFRTFFWLRPAIPTSQPSSQISAPPTSASETPASSRESAPSPSYNKVMRLNHILE